MQKKKKGCTIKRISAVKNHMEEMTERKSSGNKDKNNLTKNKVPSAAVQPACQFNLPMEKRRKISQNRCFCEFFFPF